MVSLLKPRAIGRWISSPTRRATVRRIRRLESECAELSAVEFRSELCRAKERQVAQPGKTEPHLIAMVADAVRRSQGFRLHDVQVTALLVGAENSIVEMQTGEGKTIVTAATAAIHSMSGKSIHVATTNTYLARRDVESLGDFFATIDVTAGILPEQNDDKKSRHAYGCLLYTSPSPRDQRGSRMPSSA